MFYVEMMMVFLVLHKKAKCVAINIQLLKIK